jgi:serine/threonine protein kinase
MKGGPLTEIIKTKKRQKSNFTDEECAQIMKCIFSAMEYMHGNNIVHRDLKPGKILIYFLTIYIDNILVGDVNDLSSVKVADFGLSVKYESFVCKSVE